MAGRDAATGQSIVHAFNAIREPTDRMTAMGRWISTKIEELAAADARIERRMEHLAKTEESLKGLFDALRSQVATAYPLIEDLKKFEPAVNKITDEALKALRARSSRAVEDILENVVTQGRTPTSAKDELEGAVAEVMGRCHAALNAAEAVMSAKWNDRLTAFDRSAMRIGEAFHERVRESVDTATADIFQAAATAMPSAPEPGAATESDYDNAFDRIDLSEADVRELGTSIADSTRTMQTVLDEATSNFRRQCVEMLASAKQSMQEQVAGLSRDAHFAVNPIVDRIEEDRKLAENQIRSAFESANESLQRRALELRETGEQVVELFEQRLVQRVLLMRPRAHESLKEIERSMRQRLEKLLKDAEETIGDREAKIVARVERMRPRVLDELRSLENEIRDQTEKIESQAGQMTSWLEQKLADRIDERVQRLRQLVRGELAASTEESTPGTTERGSPAKISEQQRVEVELFLDNHRRSIQSAA